MGVYVKGMEMPVSCGKCPFKKFISWGRLDNETGYVCLANENIKFAGPYAFRNPDCPLFPVPPHGRLIDASETVRVQMYDEEHEDWYTEEMTIDDLLGQGWIDAEAPTIIPASEEGE